MNTLLYRHSPTLRLIAATTLALFILVTISLVSSPALAQSSVRDLGTKDEILSLEINKGVLVRLPRPASAVFVANPAFADIAVKSPTLVYVMGKRTGVTTLFAVDAKDRVLADVSLVVSHNLTDIRRSIQQVLPDTESKHIRYRAVCCSPDWSIRRARPRTPGASAPASWPRRKS